MPISADQYRALVSKEQAPPATEGDTGHEKRLADQPIQVERQAPEETPPAQQRADLFGALTADSYRERVASEAKIDAERAVAVTTFPVRIPPGAAAAAMKTATEFSQEFGTPIPPTPLVHNEHALFTDMLAARKAKNYLADQPMLAQWMLDKPDYARVAADGLEDLGWWETTAKSFLNSAYKGAVSNTALAYNAWLQGEAQTRAADANKTLAELMNEYQAPEQRYNPLGPAQALRRYFMSRLSAAGGLDDPALSRYHLEEMQRVQKDRDAIPTAPAAQRGADRWAEVTQSGDLASTIGAAARAFRDSPYDMTAYFLNVVAENVPIMAAAAAVTATTRNPTAGLAIIGGNSAAVSASSDVMEQIRDAGYDLSKPEDATRLLSDPEIMRRMRDRSFAYGTVVGALDAFSGGVAGKVLSKSHIGNMVLQMFTQGLMGGSGEALGKLASGRSVNWGDVLAEGIAEVAGAPMEVLTMGGSAALAARKRALAAETRRDFFKELAGQAANSKIRARMPQAFQDFLERATADGPIETIYVPSEAFQEFFQSQGVDVETAAKSLGLPLGKVQDAIANNMDVEIPMATYAAKVAGDAKADQFFAENMRFRPGELTAREAQRLADSAEEALQEASKLTAATTEQMKDLPEQIVDQMTERLAAAGRAPSVARQEARVYGAFYRTLADRTSVPVETILQRFPLPEIRGAELDAVRRAGLTVDAPQSNMADILAAVRATRAGEAVPLPPGVSALALGDVADALDTLGIDTNAPYADVMAAIQSAMATPNGARLTQALDGVAGMSAPRGTAEPAPPAAQSGGEPAAAQAASSDYEPVTSAAEFMANPREALRRPGYAILTAMREASPETAADDLARMRAELTGDVVEVSGAYKGVDQGLSYLVFMPLDEVRALAERYGQESILTSDGLVYTDGRLTPANHDQDIVGPEAKQLDFYSSAEGIGPFAVGLDFEATVPPRAERAGVQPAPAEDGLIALSHRSGQQLATIDPNFAGSGPVRGAERSRGGPKKAYYGIDVGKPGGYTPEFGLGTVEHTVRVAPGELYNWYEDASGFKSLVDPTLSPSAQVAAYEQLIKDAGYPGYWIDKGPLGRTAAMFVAAEPTEPGVASPLDRYWADYVVPVNLEAAGREAATRARAAALQGEIERVAQRIGAETAYTIGSKLLVGGDAIPLRGSAAVRAEEIAAELSRRARRGEPLDEVAVERENGNIQGFPIGRGQALNQSVSLRDGSETLAELAAGVRHNTRAVAAALEARQRARYGSIARDDHSPEARDRIANWMADEVVFELQNDTAAGAGWYSSAFQRALDAAAEAFPELATDKQARDTLTLLIAITSDGQKVVPNLAQALSIYENYRNDGTFATDRGASRQASVANNMATLQGLYERLGPQGTAEYLMQELTVRELRALAREYGVAFNSAYEGHIRLPMAAVVLGPKLGAFYANLMGAHGYLTMDRWWSRTFNRYRGTLVQAPTKAGLDRLRTLLGQPDLSDDEVIAATVAPRNAYEAKGFKNGTELEKAANTIYKAAFEGLEDQPFNAGDRSFMLDAVAKAAEILAARGTPMSVADIQATLWYYEKRLYGDLGARQSAGINYEDAARSVVAGYLAGDGWSGSVRNAGGDGTAAGGDGADVPLGEEPYNDPRGQALNQTADITSTPEFRRWFGDSKAVDENGEPRVVYHGGPDGIEAFDPARVGSSWGVDGAGFFFTSLRGDMPGTADDYAARAARDIGSGRVYPAYVRIENPYTLEDLARDSGSTVHALTHYGEDPQSPVYVFDETRDDVIRAAKAGGHDGVIFEVSHDGFYEGLFIPFNPTQIKSVNNRGTFDPADPSIMNQGTDGLRGRIFVSPQDGAAATIELFKRADLSTMLHETGHFFLDTLSRIAPDDAGLNADMIAVRSWWRDNAEALAVDANAAAPTSRPVTAADVVAWIDSGTTGDAAIDQSVYVGAHEQFARGFEAYLMEGRAPSTGLRAAFESFKAWLVSVYREVSRLGVQLDPGIRRVFDRLLASDDAIAAARKDMFDGTVFDAMAAEKLGVKPEDAARILAAHRRSLEAAHAELLREIMEPIRAAREDAYKEERERVVADVSRDVNARPVYRLIEWLGNRRWLDGEKPTDIADDLRMDRRALVAEIGEDAVKALPRGRFTLYTGEGGADPEIVASMFGFTSVDGMVKALQAAPRRVEAIQTETERVMAERHPDPVTDGSIAAAAINAMHTTSRADFLAAELEILRKATGSTLRPSMTTAQASEIARRQMNRTVVRDAVNLERYIAAERRAAVEAQQALAGEDRIKAMHAKRRQLIAHALYVEAKKVAAERDRLIAKAKQLSKKSSRARLAPDYLAAVDDVLDTYVLRDTTATSDARRGGLRAYVENMIAAGRENELAIPDKVLDEAGRVPLNTLTVDDMRAVRDTLANLEHTARLKKKLMDAKRERDLDDVVERIVTNMNTNIGGTRRSRTGTWAEAAQRRAREFLNLTKSATTLLREIDGTDITDRPADAGAYADIKSGVDEAMADLAKRRGKAAEDLEKLFNIYTTKERRQMSKRLEVPEINDAMSKWDMISVALNTGNEANLQRLTDKRVGGSFSVDQLAAILDHLDKRDWDFVQSVWDYVDTLWPEIASRERRKTGTTPTKVEAAEVQTKFGVYRGGYYPLRYDPELSATVADETNADIMANMQAGRFGKAQTRHGHLKERAKSSGRPVLIDIGVLPAHINQVLHDLALSEEVSNVWRILQHPDLKAAFIDNGRQVDHAMLEAWIQDVASGEIRSSNVVARTARQLKSGYTVSKLAFNLSTALLQASGVGQSLVVVGKKAFARGVADYFSRDPRAVAADVMNRSTFMAERETTFNKDIYDMMGDLAQGPAQGAIKRFQAGFVNPYGFWLMQKVQFYVVDMPTWLAGYRKALDSGASEADAIAAGDDVVRRAQGSGLFSDRTAIERGTLSKDVRQNDVLRMFTALASYMFTKANIAMERTGRTNFRSPVEALHWAFDMALLYTFDVLVLNLVRGTLPGMGGGSGDDKDSWLKFLARETGLGIAGTVPFIRDAASALSGGSNAYGSIVDTFIRPLQQVSQGQVDMALVRSWLNLAGLLTQFPSTATARVVEAATRDIQGDDLRVRDYIFGQHK